MAKRNKSGQKWLFGILIMVVLAYVLIATPILRNTALIPPTPPPVSCGSQGILSVGSALLTSSGNLKVREVIKVISALNNNGDCLKIQFKNTDMADEISSSSVKYSVDKTVTGDFKFISQSQTNKVNIGSGTENYYKIVDYNIGKSAVCSIKDGNKAKPKPTYTTIDCKKETTNPLSDCHCFYANNIGEKETFGLSRDFNMEYDFDIDGLGSIPIRITPSQNIISGKIGEKAFVRFEFSGLGSYWVDSLGQNYELYYEYNTQNMNIVDRETYITRKLAVSTLQNEITKTFNTYSKLLPMVTKYNTELETAIKDKTSSILSKEQKIAQISPFGETYVVYFKNPLLVPVMTVELDADYVGIHMVEGIPKLTCPTAGFTVESGKQADYGFSVKNNAPNVNEKSKFTLGIDCGSEAFADITPREVSLQGQESVSVSVRNGVSVDKDKNIICKVTATDVNSGKQDSCSYSYKADFIEGGRECSVNTCLGKDIVICEQGKMVQRTQCENICVVEEGVPKCQGKQVEICNDKIDNDKDGLTDKDDQDCQTPFDLKKILPYILGGLFGLLSLGLGYNMFAKPKGSKKADPVLTIILVLFSTGIGFLVYFVSVSVLSSWLLKIPLWLLGFGW